MKDNRLDTWYMMLDVDEILFILFVRSSFVT